MNATAKILVHATGWLVAVAASGAPPRLPPADGGAMRLHELSYHAGDVTPGTPVRHTFRVKNVGSGLLSIHVQPG